MSKGKSETNKMKMNNILKCLFVAGIGLLLSVSAKAQDGQQGQMSPQEIFDREARLMKKELVLTKEQANKLQEINKNSIGVMIALRNDQSMDRSAKIEKFRGLRTERETSIKAMLTEEQLKKYEVMQQNRENALRQQRSERRENN